MNARIASAALSLLAAAGVACGGPSSASTSRGAPPAPEPTGRSARPDAAPAASGTGTGAGTATVAATATASLSEADLAALEAAVARDPGALDEALARDPGLQYGLIGHPQRARVAALLVRVLQGRPSQEVVGLVGLLFASDRFDARGLAAGERKALFERALAYLEPARASWASHPDVARGGEEAAAFLQGLEHDVAIASIEAGRDLSRAERLARGWLQRTPPTSGHRGNVVFEAHDVLGRVALRRGDVKGAARHLRESGKTTGAAHLDTFCPSFELAGQLLAKRQKAAVLEFLDQASRICGTGRAIAAGDDLGGGVAAEHQADLDRWKAAIERGEIPDEPEWR